MLIRFAPKEARFKANLLNGRAVEVTLRPFTLLDHAWMQQNFGSEEYQNKIKDLDIDTLARIIWHQLTKESQDIFNNLEFKNSDGSDISIIGHERFLESLGDVSELLKGFAAFTQCRGDNNFVDTLLSKKKTIKSKNPILKILTNLLKFTI